MNCAKTYRRSLTTLSRQHTPSNIERFRIGTDTLTFGLTHTLAPNLVNEIRLNGSRQSAGADDSITTGSGAQRPPDWLFFPSGYSAQDSDVTFGVDGALTILLGKVSLYRARQLQGIDNLSWTVGSHQLKFGVDYRWFSPAELGVPFLSDWATPPPVYRTPGVYSAAIPYVLTEFSNSPNTAFVVQAFSAYAQDTWRVSGRLSLTYGLRWELDPGPRVSVGQAAVIEGLTALGDLAGARLVPSGRPFYPTSWSNLAPRFGLAWQIFQGQRQTVLRAGAGEYFDLAQSGFGNATYVAPRLGLLRESAGGIAYRWNRDRWRNHSN
ncbi:MAG: TonB-dependent receptor [Ignavibacteriota bacterium]